MGKYGKAAEKALRKLDAVAQDEPELCPLNTRWYYKGKQIMKPREGNGWCLAMSCDEPCGSDDQRTCHLGHIVQKAIQSYHASRCAECKKPEPLIRSPKCPDCSGGVYGEEMQLNMTSDDWYCPLCKKQFPTTLFEGENDG